MSRFLGGFLRLQNRIAKLEAKRGGDFADALRGYYEEGPDSVPVAAKSQINRILRAISLMIETMPGPVQ